MTGKDKYTVECCCVKPGDAQEQCQEPDVLHHFYCSLPMGHRSDHMACGGQMHRLHFWRRRDDPVGAGVKQDIHKLDMAIDELWQMVEFHEALLVKLVPQSQRAKLAYQLERAKRMKEQGRTPEGV